MKQLALALACAPAPTLENFVTGRNEELLDTLMRLTRGVETERILYIWGKPGSGKSHLLRALAVALHAHQAPLMLEQLTRPAVLDDAHLLDEPGQALLFRLAIAARERAVLLAVSGDAPPARLALRADVATRLGSGLVYEVHALSDDEKAIALQRYAKGRGLKLPAELVQYLMTHGSRDLRVLMAIIDALDRFSLENKRAVTLPLLRDLLRELELPA